MTSFTFEPTTTISLGLAEMGSHYTVGSMKSRQRDHWVLVVVSVVFALLLLVAAEVGLRVARVEPFEWPSAGKGRVTFTALRVDPVLGPLPKPGWSGRWMTGFDVAIDARGFRATGQPLLPSAPVRVAFLGDSCTFGWGLDTPDTFVAQLDAHQRAEGQERFDFINAATPGMSAVSGLYLLRQRILPLQPNLVVLGFSGNNAFRFSLSGDAKRFRFFRVRQLLFRSRLLHVLAALVASVRPPVPDPRGGKAIYATPVSQLHRVAAPDEFEAAMRAMVTESRAVGAAVVLLLFPRAAQITPTYQYEDVTHVVRTLHGAKTPPKPARDLNLLLYSCLDHRRLADPVQTLHERMQNWQPLYPTDAALIATLRRGARAYVAGDYAQAVATFTQAVERQPASPLARYDRGVAALAAGDRETGWRDLQEADRLACNVFVQYDVILWKVAIDLDVPVIDLLLQFQAQDGETLFRDPAHPSAAGARAIADALWPVLQRQATTFNP